MVAALGELKSVRTLCYGTEVWGVLCASQRSKKFHIFILRDSPASGVWNT